MTDMDWLSRSLKIRKAAGKNPTWELLIAAAKMYSAVALVFLAACGAVPTRSTSKPGAFDVRPIRNVSAR